MKTHQKGFGAVEVLFVILITGLLVSAGWFMWTKSRDASTVSTQSDVKTQANDQASEDANSDTAAGAGENAEVATFKNQVAFSSDLKQEILTKVAGPLVYYHNEIQNVDIRDVVIDTAPAGPGEAKYTLSYYFVSDGPADQEYGFQFGENGVVGYWQPMLCDPGGCIAYSQALKEKYPDSYNAYLACGADDGSGKPVITCTNTL